VARSEAYERSSKFTEWTSEGEMRHPVFLGLRTDKKASDVIREQT
jgi:bifunctional non-homologous end joining protein LigD